ncbi:hypothetical protein A3J90_01400 [candidate division WOR-1 bacterium RIFOXYC2_FULL_37_10]|uniref:Radical SAM core domain-containing protein n=1 Tax=candidate division WOR-1 bacterium RIFOXYB2_FULL_37_13 TaxID=1802579 RepID=A0A1F4STA2_UNCSA|nr:MAG: hypothetical protein A2310_03070 [candidate division WOR-1 bacterium RIFOXYB2_FULL_37_13]OGC35768.1 MAG: hypothetical protein A3J90_01400 [candidate division WOR-1 bacterium RIFOXYC2_FULL_37_10]
MTTNPILFQSQWTRKGKYTVQIISAGNRPNGFTGRILVGNQEVSSNDNSAYLKQISNCPDISSLQVFIDSANIAGQHVISPKEAAQLIPDEIKRAFPASSFVDGIEYFLIQHGVQPDLPSFPAWVNDFARSMQVIDGKYDEIFPPTFEFVPTLNCIFRCTECSYRTPKELLGIWERNIFNPDFHMSIDTMNGLLSRLKEHGANNILFTGGGEPLLNAGTPSAMRFAQDSLGLNVALYTNGSLLTKKKAGEILSARPVFVRVSINAGQKDVYDLHHVPLDKGINYFSKTQNGIAFLAREKERLGSKAVLGISYLVNPDNSQDVLNGARLIASLAQRYKGMINYMRFTPSVNYFGLQQHPKDFFEGIVTRLEGEAVPMLEDAGVSARIYYHRFEGLYEPREYTRCLASGWYGEIGPGGVLYHCCEKLFNSSFSFGSLLQAPLKELWGGEERKRVLDFATHAVKGETDSPCPPVCKPHELNKIFAMIERLRAEGKIDQVKTWLEQIHKIIKAFPQAYKPGQLDGFQS